MSVDARAARGEAWSSRRWVRSPERAAVAVLGVAMALYAAYAMYLTRGTGLFVDGINLFIHSNGLDPSSLLAPLNGHLVLMERSVFAAVFALFGPNFVVLRLVEVAGALLAAGLLFVLLRRRIGGPAALAPALLVLFLGSAWEVTIVEDVMTNVYAAAAGLGAFLCLDRGDRRGDVAACVLLAAAIACWTLGVAFAIGAGVLIALQPNARRRLWIVLVPLALYAGWLAWVRFSYVPSHGEAQHLVASNALLVPNFIAAEASATVAAIAGLNHDFASQDPLAPFQTPLGLGAVFVPVAAAAIAIGARRRGATPLLWGAAAALLVFWGILGLAFGIGRTPETIRYTYPGAVLVAVIAAEAWRGRRISPRALVVVFALLALALAANVDRLRAGASFFRSYSGSEQATLAAVEIARDRVQPSFQAATPFQSIPAGPYLASVDRNGSPAFSPSELTGQPEAYRAAADSTLVGALRIRLAPAPPGIAARSCTHVVPGQEATLRATPPEAVLIRAAGNAAVGLRRFATTTTDPLGTVGAGQPQIVRLPRDAYAGPWTVSVSSAGNALVCLAGRSG